MAGGVIHDPFKEPQAKTDGIDKKSVKTWQRVIKQYSGKSWLRVPFYFAETFFYLRLLIAAGYFDPDSPAFKKDPFMPFKEKELFSKRGGVDIGRMIAESLQTMSDPSEKIISLLLNSLWGNRIDLSLSHVAARSRGKTLKKQGGKILIDHSQRLARLAAESNRADIILDNAGQELVCDLITVYHFLTSCNQKNVHLHAKKYPVYVSDSTVKDVDMTIDALSDDLDEALSHIGRDLRSFLEQKRLFIHDHYFWNSPLHFNEFPGEIFEELSSSDLVLLKGDVNYRRLLSDRKWEPWDSMEEIASYFPAAFATLRTMKSEIVVDLDKHMITELSKSDPEWMVNGERGIIRLVEKT